MLKIYLYCFVSSDRLSEIENEFKVQKVSRFSYQVTEITDFFYISFYVSKNRPSNHLDYLIIK